MKLSRLLVTVWMTILALAVQAAMTSARGADNGAAKTAADDSKKGVKADAFGKKNWKPMPPPKKAMKKPTLPVKMVEAAPPPPPSAPPLPFQYLGRMIDGQVTTVFLAHQQRNLAVKVGDTIDNAYRVEKIVDNTMTLTYLPMNTQQQMSLGGPK